MRLRHIIGENDDNVIPFRGKQRPADAPPSDKPGGEVIPLGKTPPPAKKQKAPAAKTKKPASDINTDPNHWLDNPRFEKNLWKTAMKTNNPHWWELKAKTMWGVLNKYPGHPQTVDLLWSGEIPFELVKLIQTCLKRLPDGTRDGRPNPSYKAAKPKA